MSTISGQLELMNGCARCSVPPQNQPQKGDTIKKLTPFSWPNKPIWLLCNERFQRSDPFLGHIECLQIWLWVKTLYPW